MKRWPPLLDAAGNEVPVNACECGRPKEAAKTHCCNGCRERRSRSASVHSAPCNIHCATLGLRGTRFTHTDHVPGVPVPVYHSVWSSRKHR